MKRPSRADHGVKQSPVRLHIQKKAERAVNGDRQNAVEREKIRRQRDPEVGLARNYVSSVTTHSKPADASAHQPNPEHMSQLVSEDVNQNRTWETEESDQPKNRAQAKKPKFLPCPEPVRYGRARESCKKCLGKNSAERQQKNRKHKFQPARRHRQRLERGHDSPRPRNIAD